MRRCFGIIPSGRGLLLGRKVTLHKSVCQCEGDDNDRVSKLTFWLTTQATIIKLHGIQLKSFKVLLSQEL